MGRVGAGSLGQHFEAGNDVEQFLDDATVPKRGQKSPLNPAATYRTAAIPAAAKL